MKKLLLAATLAASLAGSTAANAVDFTVSEAFGTGNFGSATAAFLQTEPPSTLTSPWLRTSSSIRRNGHFALPLS